jgi:Uncharacterized conserved protein (COG2071)
MFHALRRHPFPVQAHFEHCLVLTYALPADILRTLLPPGLELDTYGPRSEIGFVAVALVQTRGLRPVGLPRALGQDFFLSGYRIFTRFCTPQGRRQRGLRILRSDTDKRRMAVSGNLLTHYNYCFARVDFRAEPERLSVRIVTPKHEADLEVTADLREETSRLPADSCFATERAARQFAGPLPYTFDYERETHSIIAIRGRRREWRPRLVTADVRHSTFFDRSPFAGAGARVVSAFHLANVPYRWDRGVRYALNSSP